MNRRKSSKAKNPYLLIKLIGKGSFGEVWKAEDSRTGEYLAVKIIDFEECGDEIEDVRREIGMLSSLNSFYVTKYLGSIVQGTKLWILMEFCEGGSCLDLIRPGVLNEEQIAVIMREMLYGLQYLHSMGKIHRDIKAANILVTREGNIKLADFGVSAEVTATVAKKNTFVGTPYWMAPEVILKGGYNSKADIWSLGITAWELCHGVPPHANLHSMRVIFIIPQQPSPRLGNNFSPEFQDFIKCCLEKKTKERKTASELLKHPFIVNAGSKNLLLDPIRKSWDYLKLQENKKNMKNANNKVDKLDVPVNEGKIISNENKNKNIYPTEETNDVVDSEASKVVTDEWDFSTTMSNKPKNKPVSIIKDKITSDSKYNRNIGRGIAFVDEFDKDFDNLPPLEDRFRFSLNTLDDSNLNNKSLKIEDIGNSDDTESQQSFIEKNSYKSNSNVPYSIQQTEFRLEENDCSTERNNSISPLGFRAPLSPARKRLGLESSGSDSFNINVEDTFMPEPVERSAHKLSRNKGSRKITQSSKELRKISQKSTCTFIHPRGEDVLTSTEEVVPIFIAPPAESIDNFEDQGSVILYDDEEQDTSSTSIIQSGTTIYKESKLDGIDSDPTNGRVKILSIVQGDIKKNIPTPSKIPVKVSSTISSRKSSKANIHEHNKNDLNKINKESSHKEKGNEVTNVRDDLNIREFAGNVVRALECSTTLKRQLKSLLDINHNKVFEVEEEKIDNNVITSVPNMEMSTSSANGSTNQETHQYFSSNLSLEDSFTQSVSRTPLAEMLLSRWKDRCNSRV